MFLNVIILNVKKYITLNIILKVILLAIMLASFLVMEITWQKEGETITLGYLRAICKSIIGLVILILLLFNSNKYKNFYQVMMTCSQISFIIGDILINFNFVVGSAFFIIGHIILMIYMIKNNKPTKLNFIILGITYFAFCCINIPLWIYNKKSLQSCAFLFYSIIISALMAFSIKEKKSIVISILLFIISDALLMINIGLNNTVMFGHFLRFIYYLSVSLLASTHEEKKIQSTTD